jgi:hypothetical protein
VHGRVSGKKRRRVVTIYVRAGESGRVVEKHRVLVKRGKAVRRTETALERRLLASIAPLAEKPAAVAEKPAKTAPTAPPRPARTAAAPPRPAERARPARRPRPSPAADQPPPAPIEYDEQGQALDDEVPPMRKR